MVMDGMWASFYRVSGSFFNTSLIFLLRNCHLSPDHIAEDNNLVPDQENNVNLQTYLNDALSWLFWQKDEIKNNDDHYPFQKEHEDCLDMIHASLGGSVSVQNFVLILLAFIVGFSLTVFIVSKGRDKQLLYYKQKSAEELVEAMKVQSGTGSEKNQENRKEVEMQNVGALSVENQTDSFGSTKESGKSEFTKQNWPFVIPQSNYNDGTQKSHMSSIIVKMDSTQFLTYTLDHLMTQLEWMLSLSASDQLVPEETVSTAASLVTPRVQRKGSIRRPRWRPLVSSPLGAANMSPDDKIVVRAWQKVEEMDKKMNWKRMDIGDFDISTVQDSRLSAVLQFYQQGCPVRAEQWSGSCLIVNYVLALLELELLGGVSCRSPLKILELRSFGSAANGTLISRTNRFDVMMLVQVQFCSEITVYHCGICDDIPPGRLILGIKETPSASYTEARSSLQQLLLKERIGDYFGMFLSQREVIKFAQKMVSNALERLKLKNKLLLDRLSFSIYLNQYSELQLCVETKMLNGLGLGLSKIIIHLIPSVQVSSQDSNLLPILYAVPPWNSQSSDYSDAGRGRAQFRIMRTHSLGIPADMFWQLNCSDLTSSFMALTERKLTSAGISGCQVMCQQILRALFSGSGKDVLLTMGEVHPYVLDSVIYFLLLESPPFLWDLACLPDRLSDCIHFLKSAVQSAWMPGFTIHNPHLMKQMPALRLLPLLMTSRQENILANLGPDAIESILSHIDSRLQETGLRRCLKDDYSTEMWEYEFFIFG